MFKILTATTPRPALSPGELKAQIAHIRQGFDRPLASG